MIIPFTIAIMFLYGFLMGLLVRWRTFLKVSLCIVISLSVVAAMLNEAVDPGDGSFVGTVLGSMLLLTVIGTLGILGFAVAHYGVRKKNASIDNQRSQSR
jgi:putative copper export protein